MALQVVPYLHKASHQLDLQDIAAQTILGEERLLNAKNYWSAVNLSLAESVSRPKSTVASVAGDEMVMLERSN